MYEENNKEIEENVTVKIMNEFSKNIDPAEEVNDKEENSQSNKPPLLRLAPHYAASIKANSNKNEINERTIEPEREKAKNKAPVMNILDQINKINEEKERTLTDEQRTRRDYKLALLKETNPKKEEFKKNAKRIMRNQNFNNNRVQEYHE